jgi:hypothetical protein
MMLYANNIKTNQAEVWKNKFLKAAENGLYEQMRKTFDFTGANPQKGSVASCNLLDLTYKGTRASKYYKGDLNSVASLGAYLLSLQGLALSIYSAYLETEQPDSAAAVWEQVNKQYEQRVKDSAKNVDSFSMLCQTQWKTHFEENLRRQITEKRHLNG